MAAISAVIHSFGALFAPTKGDHDTRTWALFILAVFAATLGLELSQMVFAVIGAAAYAALQAINPPRPASPIPYKKVPSGEERNCPGDELSGKPPRARGRVAAAGAAAAAPAPTKAVHPWRAANREPAAPAAPAQKSGAAKPDFRQPSTQPVQAPTFEARGFAQEVDELLVQLSPSKEGDRAVQQLVGLMRQTLQPLIPEVEIVGFASADPMRGTAFGVAVPDVDIVVSVKPEVLAARLHGRLAPRSGGPPQLDARKLQKSAIRACTDRLVASGGFKFRRSAFRCQEPKVTLLAPAALGIHNEAIPIDFSVNCTTPLYNAALLTECGQIDARAKELILLVKRWAKDRGVCHAAKGHLSPYSWSLLAIYFLQVGDLEEGPLLPPLEGFALSCGLAGKGVQEAGKPAPKTKWTSPSAEGVPRTSVADLFKQFASFYKDFDWRAEAVSVRTGKRAPPDLALPLHIVLREDGSGSDVGPSIEDPFEPKRNLGEFTTSLSLERLRQELNRAEAITSDGAGDSPSTLSELLEPWVPPERSALADDE